MRRLTTFALAVAAAMTVHGTAQAAAIIFEATSINATSLCVAPCFQIQAFAESTDGSQTVQAIQFDVDINNATVANLPSATAPNSNGSNGVGVSSTYTTDDPRFTDPLDPESAVSIGIWDLSATVAQSPRTDVLFVLASGGADPRALSQLNDIRTSSGPSGPATCSGGGCNFNATALGSTPPRVYLGRFRISDVVDGSTMFTINGVEGIGSLVTDVVTPLNGSVLKDLEGASCTFQSGSCRVEAPEPAAMVLLGAMLAGFGLVRRRV
jgi:hypothetical protein